jgi:hypothetical protein
VAAKNIQLNTDETLSHVSKIAETMAEAAVPGPVPPPSAPTSPIDVALNAVVTAVAEKAAESSKAIAARGLEHHAESLHAVGVMQTQEEENAARITEIQSEVPGAGLTVT